MEIHTKHFQQDLSYYIKNWHCKQYSMQQQIWKQYSSPIIWHIYTVSKNDTDVAHYNYDTHEGILIIFGRYVTVPRKRWKVASFFYYT